MLNEASKIATRSGKTRIARQRFASVAVFLMVAFLSTGAQAQEKTKKSTSENKQMMEQMMKDPLMMNMMMDRIADDKHMRMEMMEKMMKHSESDSSEMMDMCKMMMKNKKMHDMMMGGGMMEQHNMKGKSSDTTMTDHKEHHNKN